MVDHAVEYVRGKVHTNGLEDFWSVLKRGLKGTYVSLFYLTNTNTDSGALLSCPTVSTTSCGPDGSPVGTIALT